MTSRQLDQFRIATIGTERVNSYTDRLGEATPSRYRILFRLMAAGCAMAAVCHVAALAIPAFGKMAYAPGYPPLRHVTFVIVDSLASFLFLSRPRWFIWPYLVLTIQILQGHGLRGWRTWADKHQLNWVDAITVFGALLGLVLLALDLVDQRRGEFMSDQGRRTDRIQP
jgi:hypothetical protein